MIKICYFGDSLVSGQLVEPHERWTYLLGFGGIVLGKNGNTTRLALERLPQVYNAKPDILVVVLGLNDCNYWVSDNGLPRVLIPAFENNMHELYMKATRAGVKKMVVATNYIPPVDRDFKGNSYNSEIWAYNRAIRRVCWTWNDKTSIADIESVKFEVDDFVPEPNKIIHLNAKGHIKYANAIKPYIQKAIDEVRNETSNRK